jgi:hypothetical protein
VPLTVAYWILYDIDFQGYATSVTELFCGPLK